MSRTHPDRRRWLVGWSAAFVALLLSISLPGFGDGAPGTSTMGTLEVTVVTRGPGVDRDGYTIATGAETTQVGVNETTRISTIEAGIRTIGLSGIAAHCTLTSESPQLVEITARSVTRVELEVHCGPRRNHAFRSAGASTAMVRF